MTVEVAVMNRSAVALAADSTVTLSGPVGQTSSESSEKLFSLGRQHPVAVMLFGNALFTGVPWDTVIKAYQQRLASKTFPQLDDYARDFLRFLKTERTLFAPAQEEDALQHGAAVGIARILDSLREAMEEDERAEFDATAVNRLASTVVNEFIEELNALPYVPGASMARVAGLLKRYGAVCEGVLDAVWDEFTGEADVRLSHRNRGAFVRAILLHYCKEGADLNPAGLVFAGFGEKEHFPRCTSLIVESRLGGQVKYRIEAQAVIEVDNLATIVPFGETDAIDAFITGIDPLHEELLPNDFESRLQAFAAELRRVMEPRSSINPRRLEKKIEELVATTRAQFEEEFEEFIHQQSRMPLLGAVAALPTADLAQVAESLVGVAVLKQRVSLEQSTVGGPIDVAVITKGDGFMWARRKHLFAHAIDPETAQYPGSEAPLATGRGRARS